MSQHFNSENTAFSATASDSALADGYDRHNASSRVAVVKREAIRNATSGAFSPLMCLFALSSVTGMPIRSVYPEKLGTVTKYSQYQNGVIHPRAEHKRFSGKVVDGKEIKRWTSFFFGLWIVCPVFHVEMRSFSPTILSLWWKLKKRPGYH
jgi:hypothetical protein